MADIIRKLKHFQGNMKDYPYSYTQLGRLIKELERDLSLDLRASLTDIGDRVQSLEEVHQRLERLREAFGPAGAIIAALEAPSPSAEACRRAAKLLRTVQTTLSED